MKPKTDISALPQECLENAISRTNPRDSCRLALLNSAFGSAAQSETVWERFLPSDYLAIIAQSTANLEVVRSISSKKELFLYLCDHHFLIDDGKKSIWLDKWSGKKCYMLAPRDLDIVWGYNLQHWEWISLPESRFPEVAKLLPVFWLEIRGKITTDKFFLEIGGKITTDKLSPNTTYVAYLVFTTTSEVTSFDYTLVNASFGISGQDSSRTFLVCLDPIAAEESKCMTEPFTQFWQSREQLSVQRDDSWMEVELGEFYVSGTEEVELEMSLKDVKGQKSGFINIIEGIEIRPKRVK